MKKLHKQNGLKRSNSAIEFDVSALSAANRRQIYSCNRSASSEQEISDQSEHSEKLPLVNARLDNLAKLFFSKSMPAESGNRDTIESALITRPNLKCQYSALDSGNGVMERSPRERVYRDEALNATKEWIENSNGRYEIIAHLDEIGSRRSKNWFLVNDSSVRTDRLMTLLPLPPDCVALDGLQQNECSSGIFMELLGSLHHPYIYPVLDLDFLRISSTDYACLVTPFNSRGCLKDLIYKAQWNEPWVRKYTRKPYGLPASQIQRLGRQILEALLFLKERGFPLHGHLHSGNVILQNGAARLSGLENGLLGLSSRVNAVLWSRSLTEIENIDIICFGHLLYEMCTGVELRTPKPSMRMLKMELDNYPQILDIIGLIFDPQGGVRPSLEELVLCDLFRGIDLRELRGPCFSTIKPSLSRSTLNLLQAVKKRQSASLGRPLSESGSPGTPPSTPRDRRSGICSSTMKSFDISNHSEKGLFDEIFVGQNQNPLDCRYQHLELQLQPIDYSDNNTFFDVKSFSASVQKHDLWFNSSTKSNSDMSLETIESSTTTKKIFIPNDGIQAATTSQLELQYKMNKDFKATTSNKPWPEITGAATMNQYLWNGLVTSTSTHSSNSNTLTTSSFNNQLTTDLCSYNNTKSRRMEYSLKCLKYRRSDPSQDSAFGSLTDGDLSTSSSSFRLSSFQSISSPIDEGIEDVIATTTAINESCLKLATASKIMISLDCATSSPCREMSPSNFVATSDGAVGSFTENSFCSSSTVNTRPQQFLDSFSPKVRMDINCTINSNNSLPISINNAQQFDPPKILVNNQNSIYTTSPSKRSGTIEVFSQKYRVSSFEDMSSKAASSGSGKQLKHSKQMKVFRSLEEERRIDCAFKPIRFDRTNSEIRENMQSDKYKKLTHASFRIRKTSNQINASNEIPSACDTYTTTGQPGKASTTTVTCSINSRQTIWRDSKFYRKNRISKSNDSLLETLSNQPVILSPVSLRNNHYDFLCDVAHSNSQQLLNRYCSANENSDFNQTLIGSVMTLNRFGNKTSIRRYSSSKSEDLTEQDNYLCVMDSRKSYSERHLVNLTKLKSSCLPETMNSSEEIWQSEDDLKFIEGDNTNKQQCSNIKKQQNYKHEINKHQNLKQHCNHPQAKAFDHLSLSTSSINNNYIATKILTTSLGTLPCYQNISAVGSSFTRCKTVKAISTRLLRTSTCKSLDNALDITDTSESNSVISETEENTSTDELSFHQLREAEIFKMFAQNNTEGSSCCEEKIPLLDSVEMSPISSIGLIAHQLRRAEISKMFAQNNTGGRSCCEEKTPLLDGVEMSPISPIETELNDRKQM